MRTLRTPPDPPVAPQDPEKGPTPTFQPFQRSVSADDDPQEVPGTPKTGGDPSPLPWGGPRGWDPSKSPQILSAVTSPPEEIAL